MIVGSGFLKVKRLFWMAVRRYVPVFLFAGLGLAKRKVVKNTA